MSFQPQNPFEFVEQMLINAGQTVSQGFGRGIQAREQRAAAESQAAAEAAAAEAEARREHGRTVQQYGIQLLPTLHQLAAEIGDEDPELVRALGQVAAEVERGVMSDPNRAAELIGNARAQLQRRQTTTEVVDFPASFLGEGAMSDEMATMAVRSEHTTTEEFTPQEIIAYSYARAGEIERLRALSDEERQRLADMAMKEFESGLIADRQAAQSNAEFGRSLVDNARTTLGNFQAVVHLMPPELQAQYEPQITALQSLATLSPQQAYAMYEQSGLGGGPGVDVSLALAEIAGMTQVLNDRQTRIRSRFDNLVERIQDDRDDINRDAAIELLRDVESYLPGYYIDPAELNMVRDYLGLESALYSARDYVADPAKMAAGLSAFSVIDPNGTVRIDMARLSEGNPELFQAYLGDPGVAQAALTEFFMQRSMTQQDYAQSVSEAARTVLGTGVGYSQLSNEAKVEVKRALGRPSAGDAWVTEELARRAQLAADAAEATHRATLASAEITALGLDAQLTEWAQAGNYGALVAYQQADPTRANNGDLNRLISEAREMHQANLDMVRYDRDSRRAASREALRKMRNGEYLNDVEREALRAQFELDEATAIEDMLTLGLRTHGEVATVLAGIAEIVPEGWWDEAVLPDTIVEAVERLGLMPTLKSISKANEYARGADVRDDVTAAVLNWAEVLPEDSAAEDRIVRTADDEMRAAGFSDAMRNGFLDFIRASWFTLSEDARRAESGLQLGWANNELGWANHYLRARELAEGNDLEGAKNVIGFVDTLVDNQRQAINAEHAGLVALGCAEPTSQVFGGVTKLQPTNTVADGPYRGEACSVVTEPFTATLERFNRTQSWHTSLVNSFASDYGITPPSMSDFGEPQIASIRPRALDSLGSARRWDRDFSNERLEEMPGSDLLSIAAGLARAISGSNYGDYDEQAVRALYSRVGGLLASRYGQEQARNYISQIVTGGSGE